MRKKIHRYSLFIILLSLPFLQNCNPNNEFEPKNGVADEIVHSVDNEIKDNLGKAFAKKLSHAMKIPEVSKFIREETAEGNEDTHSIMFQKIKNKEIKGNSPNLRGMSYSFSDIIENIKSDGTIKKRSKNSRMGISEFLDSLQAVYPLMEISIPDLAKHHSSEWDGKSPLKVAYTPDDFAYLIPHIEAYDAEGNVNLLDPINEPDELHIVIGHDRRTYAVEHEELGKKSGSSSRTVDCYSNVQPYYLDETYAYYDMASIDDCLYGGDEDPWTPDPDDWDDFNDPDDCIPKARRWTYNGTEEVVGFKYNTIEAFRKINGWSGSPYKHKLTIAYGDFEEDKFKKVVKIFYPSRGDLRNNPLFKKAYTTWFNVSDDTNLIWNYKRHGDQFTYFWEADKSGVKDVTYKIGSKTKVSAKIEDVGIERELNQGLEIKRNTDDEILGQAPLMYCNDSNGYEISTGTLTTHIRQKP